MNAQKFAADPNNNVWVNASAGSGKTKVLVDRLINILLAGYRPERILCLTFTKAAAVEMNTRLQNRLRDWINLSDNDLLKELELLGHGANKIQRARTLFTLVLEEPLQIQTLHGFCQGLLMKFPFEAGLKPYFRLLEEAEVQEKLKEATHKVLKRPGEKLQQGLDLLTQHISDTRFEGLLNYFQINWHRFVQLQFKEIKAYLMQQMNLEDLDFPISTVDWDDFLELYPFLNDINDPQYWDFFLTKTGTPRAKIVPKELKAHEERFQQEAIRLAELQCKIESRDNIRLSLALLALVASILGHYRRLKKQNNFLDYHDLIFLTKKLLSNPDLQTWILYKLDYTLAHILVDEAQDTSLDQWQILWGLTQEFFWQPGHSIFVVGDFKQAIYGFQGANPKDFLKFQQLFQEKLQGVGKELHVISLDRSFRTNSPILNLVDAVCSTHFNTTHKSARLDAIGNVEIWPLVANKVADDIEPWPLPIPSTEVSAAMQLADSIACKIKTWLNEPRILSSSKKIICADDIMILLKKRSALFYEIIKALNKHQIPCAGSDRLFLTKHLACKDFLALGKFLILPEDDLSLACVLKSPLGNISEDELFQLCHSRTGSLWQEVKKHPFANKLREYFSQLDLITPYQFFSKLIKKYLGVYQNAFGPDAKDACLEFLEQVLAYEQGNPPSMVGFIHWFEQQQISLKRNVQNAPGVKIMTVHGSKGLQAPVVIMADANHAMEDIYDPILWDVDTDGVIKSAVLRNTAIPYQQYLREKELDEIANEHQRLLYVAMTRAQDELYVTGISSNKSDTWYQKISSAMQTLTQTSHYGNGQPPKGMLHNVVKSEIIIPEWLSQKPLTIHKKVKEFKTESQERGILIHRLLEILPNLPKIFWPQHSLTISKGKLSQEDIEKVWQIIDEFSHLFVTNSVSEAIISAQIADDKLHGRLDRLIIEHDTVHIIDYKTSKKAIAHQAHIAQLKAYKEMLEPIYPNHKIQCWILWTNIPKIEEVF